MQRVCGVRAGHDLLNSVSQVHCRHRTFPNMRKSTICRVSEQLCRCFVAEAQISGCGRVSCCPDDVSHHTLGRHSTRDPYSPEYADLITDWYTLPAALTRELWESICRAARTATPIYKSQG